MDHLSNSNWPSAAPGDILPPMFHQSIHKVFTVFCRQESAWIQYITLLLCAFTWQSHSSQQQADLSSTPALLFTSVTPPPNTEWNTQNDSCDLSNRKTHSSCGHVGHSSLWSLTAVTGWDNKPIKCFSRSLIQNVTSITRSSSVEEWDQVLILDIIFAGITQLQHRQGKTEKFEKWVGHVTKSLGWIWTTGQMSNQEAIQNPALWLCYLMFSFAEFSGVKLWEWKPHFRSKD